MKHTITIGWLYPELMSTYGDRGNVLILEKRCVWRGIACTITPIDFQTTEQELSHIDMIFGGGAQDRQQGILIDDLRKRKGPILRRLLNNGVPGLFVCGSPQLLGHSYMMADGATLEGLGLFDMVTKHGGMNTPRCIGNIVISISTIYKVPGLLYKTTVVGFENHGGRTYLGSTIKPFGIVQFGNGNNTEDSTEGAIYKNWIATYLHGPLLAKNPHIADYLIAKTIEIKYGKKLKLEQLDDTFSWQAHRQMLERMKITIE